MKAALIVPIVLTGLVLSACGWTSSGSVGEAAPSVKGYEESSPKGTVKSSTSGNMGLLTVEQADQRAQDRCLELESGWLNVSPMRKESDPTFMVMKMPGIRFVQCVGERLGGTKCTENELNQVAFQRAKVNGEAEVLKCSVGDGVLFWLRIEAFPGSG